MKLAHICLGLSALIIGTLGGCGGGGGSNDGGAATGGAGTGAPVVAAPTGTAPVTLTGTTPAATFAALTLAVPAVSVSIASPPKVTFSLTDGKGNAIIGFGSKSQTSSATVASYPNLSFALAKLVPGTGTAPSRWVSYIVTTVPNNTTAAGATRPTTDNTGSLVDNGNGTYTYTFFRDITKVKDQVAAMTIPAGSDAADLDDLTYDPTLVHRLTIQISGNAPGTGTNTPDGVQLTPGVVMANPVNVIYDFIPATGQPVTASGRDIAATAKCNDCHQNLGGFPTVSEAASDATFHGGNRNKIEYCVVCHTEQRKFGRAEAVVLADGNYDAVVDANGALTSGKGSYRINGLAVGNLKQHIHKIHMSANLTKTGYYYGGVQYEKACKFPQDIRNCTKCHDGSATSTAPTAQGDNWMNVPNRSACGACHDGINFATGKGTTLADFKAGKAATSIGHVGGAKADDSQCALCHDATVIPVYHIPVTPPSASNSLLLGGTNSNTNAASIASNRDRLPAGAIKVSYEIQSVSRNASKQPVMVFRMLQNGVATPFNDPATKTEIWDNFMGAPSVYFVFAVPQDGIVAPADFNASTSAYLRTLWNKNLGGTPVGTLAGPDASGFYTATLTTVTIPDSAVMLTGGLGYSYNVKTTLPLTQTNVAGYPTAAATGTGLTAGMPNRTGGLIVITPDAQKVATGYTGRRAIVEDARCNKCHLELGTFTEDAFHAGQRNDGSTCSWCHTPNKDGSGPSGWSADSTYFVHAIHAAAKRTQPFTWHAVSATDGFFDIGYPGILKNCETCHLPGTYDFSAAASTSALPNRLYRQSASGTTVAATISTSPYIAQTAGTAYGAAFSFSAATGVTTPAAGTTLVNSPIAAACFACHDSALDISHMESNGGSINDARTGALAKTEQCTLCHLSGKVADIKAMHAK